MKDIYIRPVNLTLDQHIDILIKLYNVFIVKHCLPTINAEYQRLERKRLKLNIICKSNFYTNITHMHLTRPTRDHYYS